MTGLKGFSGLVPRMVYSGKSFIPHCRTGFRVSFRIFVKGGKRDNCRVKGGKDYSMFFHRKNDIALINLIILGGSGGMLPQENFLMF